MVAEKTGEKPERPSKELGSVVQKFVQSASFSAFERLLASYLVQSISGNPLDSLIFILRGAFSLDDEQREALEIEQEEVKALYAVAQALKSVAKTTNQYGDTTYAVKLDSVFYPTHIVPWQMMQAYSFTYASSPEMLVLVKEMESADREKKFLFASERLNLVGYNHMVSDFLNYSTPKCQELTRKLSSLVSPSTWHETYSLITGSDLARPKEKLK